MLAFLLFAECFRLAQVEAPYRLLYLAPNAKRQQTLTKSPMAVILSMSCAVREGLVPAVRARFLLGGYALAAREGSVL